MLGFVSMTIQMNESSSGAGTGLGLGLGLGEEAGCLREGVL